MVDTVIAGHKADDSPTDLANQLALNPSQIYSKIHELKKQSRL